MATLLICLIFGVPKMSHQSVFKIFKKKKRKNHFFPTLESTATGRAGFMGGQPAVTGEPLHRSDPG